MMRCTRVLSVVAALLCGCSDNGGDSVDAGKQADAASGIDGAPGPDADNGNIWSCDQRTLQSQCHTYTDLSGAALTTTENACGTSQGTWLPAQPCPTGHDASCSGYTSGSITLDSYYYGNIGLTEQTCTTMGGTWQSSLPDYAGSCWPGDYECQAWEASWDTPTSVAAACGDGTYDAEPCPTPDLVGTCTVASTSRTYHYYTGYANIAYVRDTLCGLMGGTWADA